MNLGAAKPEDDGAFFAWGETTTKSYFEWSTYTLCNGSFSTMTKYCTSVDYGTVDNKIVLEIADDVATQKLGGSWRIPTDAEWTELMNTDNCTWTWTTENSVNGYRFTSKKTGNSIFLPAAGRRIGSSLYEANSLCYYWSSSLHMDYSYYAWSVYYSSGGVNRANGERFSGLSVRPVCD